MTEKIMRKRKAPDAVTEQSGDADLSVLLKAQEAAPVPERLLDLAVKLQLAIAARRDVVRPMDATLH